MRKKTVKLMTALLLCFNASATCYAAKWVKLAENSRFKLQLDKQSVSQQDSLKKAWVKLDYTHPKNNPETLDTSYNNAKSLWYFDCTAQKSATTQVFQYANTELIYSARVDVKDAEFIEPEPESEVDIAMRHVCQISKAPVPQNKPAATSRNIKPNTKAAGAADKVSATKAEAAPAEAAAISEAEAELVSKSMASQKNAANKAKDKVPDKSNIKDKSSAKDSKNDKAKNATVVEWTYDNEEKSASNKNDKPSKKIIGKLAEKTSNKTDSNPLGPANWGKLSPDFATCDTGKNQSPINIEDSIMAQLKPIRSLQRFAAKEILHNGHTIQVNFKQGNMMVLDSMPFQLKHVQFHAPSEHHIKGKSFPLEAQFVHVDSKGNIVYVALLFEDGKENVPLGKLLAEMPTEQSDAKPLKARVLPSEFMPVNKIYYRYSGSLTTPPCTEGVRWVVMKTPTHASTVQIEALSEAIKHTNNRPIQPLNGRMLIE